MSNTIWLMYTEYLAQGNSERRDTGIEEFFRPDICIFTNKESLYEALKINLWDEGINYYKNQTQIFDYIIENGGYVKTPDHEEIRIETKKLNKYSDIKLYWGLKSRKEIFNILEEIGVELKNRQIEEDKWKKEIYDPWLIKNRKNEDKAEKENTKKLKEIRDKYEEKKKKDEEKKKKDEEKKKKKFVDDDDDE